MELKKLTTDILSTTNSHNLQELKEKPLKLGLF